MSRSVSLSACLIVRDAAQDLAWCLDSLVGEVDEIIVVDTGSQDATKSIARKYTKHVFSFAWNNDFSAARNFALSKSCGRWIFFPDSDERLMGEKGALRRAVRGAEGLGERALSILRREVNEDGKTLGLPDNPALRILRHVGGLAYHDPVHEYLAYPDGTTIPAPLVPADELFLFHRGYAPSRKAAKAKRNLAILEKIENDGKKKPYLHYYLSGLYMEFGRYADACREAELSLTAKEQPVDGALDVWKNYLAALDKLGRERQLMELCERARESVPALPETYAYLGVAAMNRGDFAEGERMLLEAIQRETGFAKACPHDYDTFHEALPQVQKLLSECRKQLGKTEEASVTLKNDPSNAQEKTTVLATMPETEEVSPEEAAQIQSAESFADLLPPAAGMVVIFGCGRGASGEAFLQRSPMARVYGFATTRAEAILAGRVLTASFVGSPETAELELYGLSGVDCIAYDLLSCGTLTEAAVQHHAESLAQDGQMVFRSKPGDTETLLRLTGCLQEIGFRSVLIFAETGVARVSRIKTSSCAVQTLIGESTVTARVRVTEPNRCLATVPGFAIGEDENRVNRELIGQMASSIIIRQRKMYSSIEEAQKFIAYIRKSHQILLYEIDDNPNRWSNKATVIQNMDFIGSHAVQVSTPVLADVIRPYNPHVFVFENHLKELPAVRNYASEEIARGGCVTIFFGALNREEDYDDILPEINKTIQKYGEKLHFRVLADTKFYKALHTTHKEFIADPDLFHGRFIPYEAYQRVLHTADISLLPLHDTAFNRTKSDLKFIESAAHGAVVLASPTVYERTVVDGCTGCIYHSPEEFSEKLTRLIEDRQYRHAIAAAGRQYVKDYRLLSQHYLERAKAYRWMIEHHAELDADLEARLKNMEH